MKLAQRVRHASAKWLKGNLHIFHPNVRQLSLFRKNIFRFHTLSRLAMKREVPSFIIEIGQRSVRVHQRSQPFTCIEQVSRVSVIPKCRGLANQQTLNTVALRYVQVTSHHTVAHRYTQVTGENSLTGLCAIKYHRFQLEQSSYHSFSAERQVRKNS